ncbi:MAG: ankyrin repeat domain-containing protein [Noviherbaspirillum sp.]
MAEIYAKVAEADAKNPLRAPADAERIAQAFRQGDVADVGRLLRTEGGKSWARTHFSKDGHNQLMIAAYHGNVRMVEALLELDQGALAEQKSRLGFTALLIAAGAGIWTW